MFARARFPLIHPAGPDDMLAGMAHAMGCATLVDGPHAPPPASAAPPPTMARARPTERRPAGSERPR